MCQAQESEIRIMPNRGTRCTNKFDKILQVPWQVSLSSMRHNEGVRSSEDGQVTCLLNLK